MDGGVDARTARPWLRWGFAGKGSRGRERHTRASALSGSSVRVGGQLAPGPGSALGVVCKAWAETPLGGVRKGKELTARGDFFSVVLDSVCPQRLFFPSSAKHFF